MKLYKLFKSILSKDRAPIVVCDTEDSIVYMNPSAIESYGRDLTGRSIKECHNDNSNKKIEMVLSLFRKNDDNDIVFTYHNEKENKDVYMVALRDDDGSLIGYYEKHEYRNREKLNFYEAKNK